MYHKTIHHTLSDGTKAKFTIKDKSINGEVFYYSLVINTDLDSYTNKSETEREVIYGVEVTNGRQQTVYYRNPELLIADLVTKYGVEWLESER